MGGNVQSSTRATVDRKDRWIMHLSTADLTRKYNQCRDTMPDTQCAKDHYSRRSTRRSWTENTHYPRITSSSTLNKNLPMTCPARYQHQYLLPLIDRELTQQAEEHILRPLFINIKRKDGNHSTRQGCHHVQ